MKHIKLFEEHSGNESMRRLELLLGTLRPDYDETDIDMVDDRAVYYSNGKELSYDGGTGVVVFYNEDNDDEFTADWPLDNDEVEELKDMFIE